MTTLARSRLLELPSTRWLVLTGLALASLVAFGPLVGFAIACAGLLGIVRPLHFGIASFVLVTGASFVDYTGGLLTPQLALLSVVLAYMLICWYLTTPRPLIRVSHTPLTRWLLLYLGLSAFNLVRGIAQGNSLRYAGLELLSVLGLGWALMVGTHLWTARARIAWRLGLLALGLGHGALGFYWFALLHVRTGRLSFTPVPGLIAALFFDTALRARTRAATIGWLAATVPMVAHQFFSFTRGYWIALPVAFAWSCALYIRGGEGASARARRVLGVGAISAVLTVVLALGLGSAFGITNLFGEARDRLASSGTTEFTYQAGSNVVRLVEYVTVLQHIATAPWLGHGLGYAFVSREPFQLALREQWATHDNYLLVWMKQGLLGLILFVGMLIAGVRTGARLARDPDGEKAGWACGTSAATLYVIVYCLVHFPLGEINTVYTLAMMWGVLLSMFHADSTALVWRADSAPR